MSGEGAVEYFGDWSGEVVNGKVAIRIGSATFSVHPSAARDIAALVLSIAGPDGKPLFTRADVELLRVASFETWGGSEGPAPLYRAAENLADRLAALLPPEEPEP